MRSPNSQKNFRYFTSRQVVIDAGTRLAAVVGQTLPGNRNDCKAWSESGAKATVGPQGPAWRGRSASFEFPAHGSGDAGECGLEVAALSGAERVEHEPLHLRDVFRCALDELL